MSDSSAFWRRCSTCKKPIPHNALYHVCSVSTCNRERTGYVFCSVSCWDAHVPVMRHRKAWAEERRSPPPPEQSLPSEVVSEPAKPGRRRRVRPPGLGGGGPGGVGGGKPRPGDEVLVVASKIRAYIKERADMNTSASVYEVLSDRLRDLCDQAIDAARADGRKTVLDRDFDALS